MGVSDQSTFDRETLSEFAPATQRLFRIYDRIDYESTNPHSHSRYTKNTEPIAWYLILTLADAVGERTPQRVFVSHQTSASRNGSHAVQNRYNDNDSIGTQSTNDELSVQVQIEQTSSVDYSLVYGQEDRRKPREVLDGKQGPVMGYQWELASAKSPTEGTNTV
jgi:hypothetical protein